MITNFDVARDTEDRGMGDATLRSSLQERLAVEELSDSDDEPGAAPGAAPLVPAPPVPAPPLPGVPSPASQVRQARTKAREKARSG